MDDQTTTADRTDTADDSDTRDEILDEQLVEEISIDGMCGVY